MYSLLRQALFKLEPETAHHFSLASLKFLNKIKCLPEKKLLAPRTVMGLNFPNPVGLAAGLDKDGEYIDALAALGFGFIEVGTVTPKPQTGNLKPRLFRIPEAEAIINRMGFNSKGVDYLLEQLSKTKYKGILGINIGKNLTTAIENALDDYLFCLRKVFPYASYSVINISSPNTPGLRELQFGNYLNNLLAALKKEQQILTKQHKKEVPLVVKIAPDMNQAEIKAFADAALANKMDGIIATNTTVSREGVEQFSIAKEAGGLSGKPLFEKSTQIIKDLSRALQNKIPIIAVGGIMSAEEALTKIKAGASLIQLYTGFIYSGPKLIEDIVNSLKDK